MVGFWSMEAVKFSNSVERLNGGDGWLYVATAVVVVVVARVLKF